MSPWQYNVNWIARKDDNGIYQGKLVCFQFPRNHANREWRYNSLIDSESRRTGTIVPTSFHNSTDLLNSAGSGGT